MAEKNTNIPEVDFDEAAEKVQTRIEELLEEKFNTKGNFLGLVQSEEEENVYSFYYEIPLEAYREFDTLIEIGAEILRLSRRLGHFFTFHPIPDRDE